MPHMSGVCKTQIYKTPIPNIYWLTDYALKRQINFKNSALYSQWESSGLSEKKQPPNNRKLGCPLEAPPLPYVCAPRALVLNVLAYKNILPHQ